MIEANKYGGWLLVVFAVASAVLIVMTTITPAQIAMNPDKKEADMNKMTDTVQNDLKFGDAVENIHASVDNPSKYGFFIHKLNGEGAEYASPLGVHSTAYTSLAARTPAALPVGDERETFEAAIKTLGQHDDEFSQWHLEEGNLYSLWGKAYQASRADTTQVIRKLKEALERARDAWYMTGNYDSMDQFKLEPVVKIIDEALAALHPETKEK